MPRFDIFANPNRAATHPFFVDVQSNLVRLSTRWCISLLRGVSAVPALPGIQAVVEFQDQHYLERVRPDWLRRGRLYCARNKAWRRVVPGYGEEAQRSAGRNTAGIDKSGQGEHALIDTGNLLAVPAVLLQRSKGRLSSEDQFRAESCIEFMLRGY